MRPTKIAFEERYSDESGVEFAVCFDSSKQNEELKFECINTVEFPADRIDWIIECLTYIRAQIL